MGASESEIKHAFRKKVKLAHPDLKVQDGDDSVEEDHSFIELKNAYEFLMKNKKNN